MFLYESLPGHMTEQQNDHHQFPAELLERQGEDLNTTEGKTPALGFKMWGAYSPLQDIGFLLWVLNFFFPNPLITGLKL